jgi:hypothetical protein
MAPSKKSRLLSIKNKIIYFNAVCVTVIISRNDDDIYSPSFVGLMNGYYGLILMCCILVDT